MEVFTAKWLMLNQGCGIYVSQACSIADLRQGKGRGKTMTRLESQDRGMSPERVVVLMRGLPGSGKSTWIANNYPTALVCSADHWFVGEDGVYRFERTQIGAAHDACRAKFLGALEEGVPVVVVDNTNVTHREIAPYVAAAEAAGYRVRIVRLHCDPETCLARNVHGVGSEVIKVRAALLNQTTIPWSEEVVDTTITTVR